MNKSVKNVLVQFGVKSFYFAYLFLQNFQKRLVIMLLGCVKMAIVKNVKNKIKCSNYSESVSRIKECVNKIQLTGKLFKIIRMSGL